MITSDAALFELSDLEVCRDHLVSQIQSGAIRLPSLSDGLIRLLTRVLSADPDPHELLALMDDDQELVGHVLRIASSRLPGLRQPLATLELVVPEMGVMALAKIAMTVGVGRAACPVGAFKQEGKALWRHSVAAAIYGETVAGLIPLDTTRHYLCGLIHGIGKLVALQAITDWQVQACSQLPAAMARHAADQFHAAIGSMVFERWRLPEQIQLSCASYRFYQDAPSFKNEAAVIYLCNRLATWATQIEPLDDKALATDSVWGALEIRREQLQSLLVGKEAVLAEVKLMEHVPS